MSGSFWKFGQDYSIESPVSKILNSAFIKINKDQDDDVPTGTCEENIADDEDNSSHDYAASEDNVVNENEEKEEENTLPTTESEYENYRPNLDVLDDLLDDDELYTELMCSNFKLLIFLKYPEVLSKLIEYVTNEKILDEETDSAKKPEIIEGVNDHPILIERDRKDKKEDAEEGGDSEETTNDSDHDSGDERSVDSEETSITLPPESEEQVETRRARIAAEILSADVWPISAAIMQNKDLLGRLWSILDHPAPLPIPASTYFMKINERLLDMDITGMLEFILSRDSLVARFLTHVDNPSLMDFLLKVISTDKPDSPTGVIKILKSQELIPKLLDHLNPEYGISTQSAAGDFIKAFVTLSTNSSNELASGIGPNELTRQLVSEEMIEKLIKIMLKGGTSLSNGVGIIIELIRKNNSDYDFIQLVYTTLESHPPTDRDPIHLIHLVKLFAKHMPDFADMLDKTKLPLMEMPFGNIEPLGFERFKICELIAELLHCSNMTLLNEPNGEIIAQERDIERAKELETSTEKENITAIVDNKSSYYDKDCVQEKDITENLGALQINNQESEEDELNDTGVSSVKLDVKLDAKVVEGLENDASGVELYDETLSDTESVRECLREKPLVGDRLKIALEDTKILISILDMFTEFPWNNFLHNVIFDIAQQIFNGPLKTGYNRFLLKDYLVDAYLTKKIVDADKACQDYEKKTGLRYGYMGHLTLIAEEISKFKEYIDEMKLTFCNTAVSDRLEEPFWKEYSETILADTREKYNTVLGDFGNDQESDDDVIRNSDSEDIIGDTEGNENYGNGENDELLSNGHDSGNMDLYYNFNNNENEENEEDYAEYSDVDNKNYYNNVETNDDDYDSDDGKSKSAESEFTDKISEHRDGNSLYNEDNDENGSDKWTSGTSLFPPDHFPSRSQPSDPKLQDQNIFHHQFDFEGVGDDDDYMDPNDDGQSYARPGNPLYTTPKTPPRPKTILFNSLSALDNNGEDEEVALGTSVDDRMDNEISSDEEDSEDEDEENDMGNEEGYSLYRSRSKEAF
ncbi:Sap190p [Saccharomyces cerevisiae YJM1460]|nr:Sap190p [Saccharomyces cerevisiae YJM1460]